MALAAPQLHPPLRFHQTAARPSSYPQSPMLQDSLTGKLAEAWRSALALPLALVTKTSRTPPEWGICHQSAQRRCTK